MHVIDLRERHLLERIVTDGPIRLRGDDATLARGLELRGLVRSIFSRKREAPSYFVASGAGIELAVAQRPAFAPVSRQRVDAGD